MVEINSDELPRVGITKEMIEFARGLAAVLQVKRTRVSPSDTLGGAVGELAFAEWWYGDWRKNELGENKGLPDYEETIEVKTSIFPLRQNLHLPIREDYAAARCPSFYVFICIDVPSRREKQITPGLEAVLVGWTTGERAHQGRLANMGWVDSFRCFLTPVSELRPMSDLRAMVNDKIG